MSQAADDAVSSMDIDLETFLHLSGELLCIISFESKIAWCNESFHRTLGFRSGELIGVSMVDLIHPDDWAGRGPTRDELLDGNEVTGIRLRCRTAQGGWRWLEWTSHLDLERELCFAAARDITASRQAEEALRGHEALSRAILWHSSSLIFVKDSEGKYLIVNDAFCRFAGLSDPGDVIGRTAADIWPLYSETIEANEAKFLRKGEPYEEEQTVVNRNGTSHYLITRALLRDDDGIPIGLVGIGTDITDRKQAASELEHRDRRLAAIMAASPDIIGIVDPSGLVTQVSAAEMTMLGYQHGPCRPQELMALVHPEDLAGVRESYRGMQRGLGRQVNARFRMAHADGHWLTLDTRARSVYDENQHFEGAVVVARDVSAKLEAQARLREAMEMAEKASQAKSEFLSRMSHELRTPLNSVLGFAQLLAMDDLPHPRAEWVQHIQAAGGQLLQLIDEVLDIARIETGHLEMSLEPVSLRGLIAEVTASASATARAAGVSIVLDADRRDVGVQADRERLRQVLANLLSNAIKYNRPGGRVEVRVEHGASHWVRLVVADTGRGMGPESVSRAFEPFERLGVDQAFQSGTGVGLALSKRLVEDMGGRLEVDSVPDVGSTFSIGLPMADAPDRGVVAPPVIERVPNVRTAEVRGPFRVMLVEEDLANLQLVERVLARRPGIEVLASMHGSLAIDLAREHKPGLILLDLRLPDIEGTEVLERLRSDDATASIPVAVVSAQAPARSVRRVLDGQVAGYLAKPLDVRALLALVDKARAGSPV